MWLVLEINKKIRGRKVVQTMPKKHTNIFSKFGLALWIIFCCKIKEETRYIQAKTSLKGSIRVIPLGLFL